MPKKIVLMPKASKPIPEMSSLIEEAKACRLKEESFEKALGRVIRRKYGEGKEGFEMYIKVISAYREMMDKKPPL
jgi:hypothetical protein